MTTEINKVTSIWNLVDDESSAVLSTSKFMFDYHDHKDDGKFPTKASWTKFINQLDRDSTHGLVKWLFKRKRTADWGEFTLTNVDNWGKVKIKFKQPVNVIFGYVNEEPIVRQVTEILGSLDFEFWYSKSSTTATSVEISFMPESFI